MEGVVDSCNTMSAFGKSDSSMEKVDMSADMNDGAMMVRDGIDQIPSPSGGVVTSPSDRVFPCGPAPAIEIKLFVGRIPRTMSEDDVRPLFAKYGDVTEVVIIRDRNTSAHKGSAFIRMACIAEADQAIRELNGQRVLDTGLGPILVKYATGEAEKLGMTPAAGEAGLDQAKLFVGSLPKNSTEEEIKQMFEKFGTVDEVYVMRDGSGAGKGCAFVKFAYKEQAVFARKSLDGKRTMPGCSRPMEVRFAESRGQRAENGASAGPATTSGQMPAATRTAPSTGGQYGVVDPMSTYYHNAYSGGINAAVPSNSTPRMVGPWKEYFNNEGRPYYHNEATCVTQWDRPAEFDQLNRIGRPGRIGETPTGPAGSNIFIFHIPNDWTDQHLVGAFSQYGNILSASIARDKVTGRKRGFGFVSFTNQRSAASAVSNMNGFMAFGKRLKVSVKQGEEEHAQMAAAGLGATNALTGSSGVGVSATPALGAAGMNPVGTPALCNMAAGANCNGAGMPGATGAVNTMMNQYAMQGVAGAAGQYGGYAGNRYAPY